jgi:hypothetical protein
VRILVANTYAPLELDGREAAAASLADALAALGHETERVRIPFAEDSKTVLEQILALRLTEISDEGELLIAVGTRAHLLRHRRKVLWLGQGDAERATWNGTSPRATDELLAALRSADRLALAEAERVFAVTSEECDRIWRFGGVLAEPLAESPAEWGEMAAALTG